MKFGKEFIRVIEQTQPEFRDKFLCYKQLKKFLKQLPDTSAADAAAEGGATGAPSEHKRELTPAERDFVRALNAELAKFNEFFMEKEEDLVMMDRALADRASALTADPTASAAALAAAATALARFHGELVLLEHWCSLNYAALVKILKKHDKRSNLSLRLPVLVNVLRQPFYSTEVLSRMVRTAEERFHALAARLKRDAAAAAVAEAADEAAAARNAGGAGGAAAAERNGDGGAAAPSEPAAAAAAAAAAALELPSLLQPLPPPPAADAPPPAPEEEASLLARTRAALSCWEQLTKSRSLGPQEFGADGAAAAHAAGGDGDSSDDAEAEQQGAAKRQRGA